MAGDDLTLKTIIEATLDSKGFEDFKLRVEKMASEVQRAGPRVSGTADVFEKFGKRLPVTGLNVLTDSLLRNAGAMQGAGRVAGVLTNTLGFLAFGLGPVGIALGAVAAAGGLAASALGKKAEEARKLEEATRTLEDKTLTYGAQLRELKERGVELTPTMERLIALERELARARASAGLVAAKETEEQARKLVEKLEQEADAHARSQERRRGTLEQMRALPVHTRLTGSQIDALRIQIESSDRAFANHGERLEKANLSLKVASTNVALMEEAMRAGEPTADRYFQTIVDGARKSEEAARKSQREWERFADFLLKFHKEEGEAAKLEAHAKAKIEERELERKLDFHRQVQEGLRKNEEEATRVVEQLVREREEAERRELETKVGIATGSADILRSLFGKNKAANIAAAIADTYAAANVALKSAPPPANFVLMAAAIATGLANVAKIRETEAGFDVLESDLLAARFGKKWAADFIRLVDRGFASAIENGPTPGVRSMVNNTTINRGTQIHGGLHLGGFFGAGKTQLLKQLNRELIVISRLEKRTALR